ncbi:hypothetical protein [Burkholderia pseudomultivorans]|uniref:hypothetical protein n=1 Tax=Burkholderia pseudomultivorans TaxID=1207504 RepID=UPI0012D9BEEC|nr:hypothetical protein [Burkholderia pseudomultivorans]
MRVIDRVRSSGRPGRREERQGSALRRAVLRGTKIAARSSRRARRTVIDEDREIDAGAGRAGAPTKKAWKLAFPGLETINDDGGGDGVVPMRAVLLQATSRMMRGQIAQPPR